MANHCLRILARCAVAPLRTTNDMIARDPPIAPAETDWPGRRGV